MARASQGIFLKLVHRQSESNSGGGRLLRHHHQFPLTKPLETASLWRKMRQEPMSNPSPRPKAKTPPRRKSRGFKRAGGLIGAQMKTAAARRGFALARLQALWPEIAGTEMAAVSQPVALATSRGPAGGLLRLGVAGAHGPQVQMLLPQLRERINGAMGPGTVGRIQIVPAKTGQAARAEPEEKPRADLAGTDISPLSENLSKIGDDNLRASLETLARNVLSRARKPQ